jgi:hypothetical protein
VISTGVKIQIKHGAKFLVQKLIGGNDTQFADSAAIFIRENICVYGSAKTLIYFPSIAISEFNQRGFKNRQICQLLNLQKCHKSEAMTSLSE